MRPDPPTLQAHIASRILAILVTAFPLAAVGLAFERQDKRAVEEFRTYAELRVYIESFALNSYWACFGLVMLMGFAYVAMIEGVAFLLRLVLRAAKREKEQPAA